MKLGFVINEVATEKNNYTTIRLARVAVARGHDVCLIGLADFIYDPSGAVYALATVPTADGYDTEDAFLDEVQARTARRSKVCVDELDVLLLRSDPADEIDHRHWAPSSGLLFAQLASARGVIVLNDPTHLMHASNKTYFQHFPEAVRPETCISRDPGEIRSFIEGQGGVAVIKPLQGSGGHGVFIVRPDDRPNLNQMIEAVTRDGYAIVQEYLPKAKEGDLRLITLNGRPLQVDGQYACFQRYNAGDDGRSNISAGGQIRMAAPDEDALRLAEMVGPKLIRDGMYLAGLDIAGDKMMEINVDTPGGIIMAEELTGVDFSAYILADLERKVRLKSYYDGVLDNTVLASL